MDSLYVKEISAASLRVVVGVLPAYSATVESTVRAGNITQLSAALAVTILRTPTVSSNSSPPKGSSSIVLILVLSILIVLLLSLLFVYLFKKRRKTTPLALSDDPLALKYTGNNVVRFHHTSQKRHSKGGGKTKANDAARSALHI